jgi:SAM-dependent methyltransferase
MTRTANNNGTDNTNACPVCSSGDTQTFLELTDMPAQDGVVHATKQAALDAPAGDISLAICRRCHFIGNLAYDPDKIQFTEYSYSKYHSAMYRNHVDEVVGMLVDNFELRHKMLIDIGCGEGYFLDKLSIAADSRGVGIDPSLTVTDEVPIGNERLKLIKDFYTDKYSHYKGDLVSCRHVIDELAAPRDFLQSLKGALRPGEQAIVYLELPNARRTFEQRLIWNIGYAKRSWFTATSLGALLRICGLSVVKTEMLFGGEYLGITGRRAQDEDVSDPYPEEPADEMIALLDEFSNHFNNEVDRWRKKIAILKKRGEQIVIWGAGMRGINFLNQFGDASVFPKIVDINKNRQGSYLSGSGFFIDSPEILRALQPKRILLSNPAYECEIRSQLENMGVASELESL